MHTASLLQGVCHFLQKFVVEGSFEGVKIINYSYFCWQGVPADNLIVPGCKRLSIVEVIGLLGADLYLPLNL